MLRPLPNIRILQVIIIPLCLCSQAGCEKPVDSDAGTQQPKESYTADERAAAAKLKPVKDSISEDINKSRMQTRQAYNNRRFYELKRTAAKIRTAKSTFGNGAWMIVEL